MALSEGTAYRNFLHLALKPVNFSSFKVRRRHHLQLLCIIQTAVVLEEFEVPLHVPPPIQAIMKFTHTVTFPVFLVCELAVQSSAMLLVSAKSAFCAVTAAEQSTGFPPATNSFDSNSVE